MQREHIRSVLIYEKIVFRFQETVFKIIYNLISDLIIEEKNIHIKL